MAESQYFFWIWNQLGKSKDEEVAEDQPIAAVEEDHIYMNEIEDVEKGLAGDTDNKLVVDLEVEPDKDEKIEKTEEVIDNVNLEEELPAYMVGDDIDETEKDKEEDSIDEANDEETAPSTVEEPPIDYNTATMSTVKDITVLKEKDLDTPPDTPSVSEMAVFKGEFTDCSEYLVHRETKEKFTKKKHDWKCICLSLICFTAILLVAVLVLFIILYFKGALGSVGEGLVIATRAPVTITILPSNTTTNFNLITASSARTTSNYIVNTEKPVTSHCKSYEFACDNGRCVHVSQKCNGEDNCGDASDELCGNDADTSQSPTMADTTSVFLSQTTMTATVPQTEVCDAAFEFECDNGECIYFFSVCDGTQQCTDNSDENNCDDVAASPSPAMPTATDPQPGACDIFEFECDNEECIYFFSKCDGIKDCSDGSDEKGCDASPSTIMPTAANPQTGTTATDPQTGTTVTDPQTGRTATYPQQGACESFEFECDDGECIDYLSECDGTQDCADNSDENNCDGCGFECPNGVCLQAGKQCNGYPDCSPNAESQDENANCSYGCVPWVDMTDIPCSLPYNSTYFPNFISKDVNGYDSIVNAELKLRQLYRFRRCDPDIDASLSVTIFCGIIFPGCPTNGQSGTVAICRGFCEQLIGKNRCETAFSDINLNLTATCSVLPEIPIDDKGEFCTYF